MTISNKNHHSWVIKSNIGKKGVFLTPNAAPDLKFVFSSTLEKVGAEWDRELKNNTQVIILSDPIEVKRAKYGVVSLIKVLADDKEMWVLTETIVDIK